MFKFTAIALALVTLLLTLEVFGVRSTTAGEKPWPEWSTVTVTGEGILFACPQGDGELLSDKGLTITATLRTSLGYPVAGFPATDLWLIGCDSGLVICGSARPFEGATDVNGRILLDGRILASGCDNTGVRLVAQGITMQPCLPIQVRSADLKSSQGGCPGDALCPDGEVDLADFSFLATHYPSSGNPGASYFACVDFATPYGGSLGLADLSRFATHLAGQHRCNVP